MQRDTRCLLFVLLGVFLLTGCASTSSNIKRKARYHYQIGTSLLMEGQFGRAVVELERARKLDSSNDLLNNLGLAYFSVKDFSRAESTFKEILKDDSSFVDAQNNLGALYLQLGRYTDAKKYFKQAAENIRNTYPYKSWANLGWAFHLTNDNETALTHTKRAISLEGRYCMAHRNMGIILESLSRFNEAVKEFENAVKYCPQSEESRYRLGLAYMKKRKREKAREVFFKLLSQFPNGKFANKTREIMRTLK
jgi:tetratricopeptide (TPR) repeat protein